MYAGPHGALNLLLRLQRGRPAEDARNGDDEPPWRGVGFELAGARLVIALPQLAEVALCPAVTPLPRSHPWLRGVVRWRAEVLAVLDLRACLGRTPLAPLAGARLLIVAVAGLHCALPVERVHGLCRFPSASRGHEDSAFDNGLRPFIQGTFTVGAEVWGIFDPTLLAADERFCAAGPQPAHATHAA